MASQISYKVAKFTWNVERFKFWRYRGAPFWAPFFILYQNTIRYIFNIIWNKKSDWFDKNSMFYPKMKCPNRNFQKMIGHFDFRSLKMSSGAWKIHFLQHVDSKEDKKFSKTVTTLIFFSSESWHIVLFKYVKIGAQNGAPEWQFSIDWKRFNLSFTQILRVFLASGLQGLRFGLRLYMSKCGHELFFSTETLKMKFWMIFNLTGPKNMDFSNFDANPQGSGHSGGSVLGSEVSKLPPS